MDAQSKDVEMEQWLSSYGLITIERILSRYPIKLSQENLTAAIKNPHSFYHKLLQIPLKNVLNGIILQQAHDYYVYVQKLYIDYLLSNEPAAPEEAPGASTREALEEERKVLIAVGEDFNQLQLRYHTLISNSQAYLIQVSQDWNIQLEQVFQSLKKTLKELKADLPLAPSKEAIEYVLIHHPTEALQAKPSLIAEKFNELLQVSLSSELCEQCLSNLSPLFEFSRQLDERLSGFGLETQEVNISARAFRTQMYEAILKSVDLIKLLPVYKIDPMQDQINKEVLYFDKNIGEKA